MNPITLLKSLFAGIPAADHIVSVNGKRKGPVTFANVALNGSQIHFEYKFTLDDQEVHVQGECPIAEAGRRGGHDTIKINGHDVDGDDIIISHRFVTGGLAILIIFEYQLDGTQVIRFDALRRWIR